MKTTSSKLVRVAVAAGLGLGMFTLAAWAQTWTAPSCVPPGCNVPAPINVGGIFQQRDGDLQLNEDLGVVGTIIANSMMIRTGEGTTTATAGKVLTALDNNGTVGWREGGAGGGSIGPSCVSENTYGGTNGYDGTGIRKPINLVINGKNICSDTNGCQVQVYENTANQPAGREFRTFGQYRQIADGQWRVKGEGFTHQSGTNGDSTSRTLSSDNNYWLYDDLSGTETSPDQWTLYDNDTTRLMEVVVCD